MAEQSDTASVDASASADRVSWGRRLAAGIADGILSAILMMGFMMAYSSVTGAGVTMPLKALGALVYGVEALVAGSMAMLAGAGIQLGFSIVLGILFALFTSRRTSIVAALFAGIVVGIVIWVAMELVVLPYMNPTMAARIALMPLAYFIAHLLYGIGLGLTPVFVRTFSRKRHDHPRGTPRRSLADLDRAGAPCSAYRKHRVLFWVGGIFATLIVALFIASFFLDDIVRARTQAAMNQKLKGYHVALAHAHLQLVGGILTLNGLKVIQQAHPHPPVADVAMMRFHIQVKELFSRRVVADVLLSHPKVHIDQTQLVAEKKDKVPLRQKGWQDALEAAYPFKINRFTIDDGDVVYIQDRGEPATAPGESQLHDRQHPQYPRARKRLPVPVPR